MNTINSTKSISIVFYKGPGTLGEKLIRLWTKSPYAHCEFQRSDGLYHSNDRFNYISRLQTQSIDPDDWESCTITLPEMIVERVEKRQIRKNGTGYDWMGIVFSQVFRLGLHNNKRWFCSKSNADDLIYAYRLMERCRQACFKPYLHILEPITHHQPQELSPSDLFAISQEIQKRQQSYALDLR